MTGVLTSGSNSMAEYYECLSSGADRRRLKEYYVCLLVCLVGEGEEEEKEAVLARHIRSQAGPQLESAHTAATLVGDVKETQNSTAMRPGFTHCCCAGAWCNSSRTRPWQQLVLLTYWTVSQPRCGSSGL